MTKTEVRKVSQQISTCVYHFICHIRAGKGSVKLIECVVNIERRTYHRRTMHIGDSRERPITSVKNACLTWIILNKRHIDTLKAQGGWQNEQGNLLHADLSRVPLSIEVYQLTERYNEVKFTLNPYVSSATSNDSVTVSKKLTFNVSTGFHPNLVRRSDLAYWLLPSSCHPSVWASLITACDQADISRVGTGHWRLVAFRDLINSSENGRQPGSESTPFRYKYCIKGSEEL